MLPALRFPRLCSRSAKPLVKIVLLFYIVGGIDLDVRSSDMYLPLLGGAERAAVVPPMHVLTPKPQLGNSAYIMVEQNNDPPTQAVRNCQSPTAHMPKPLEKINFSLEIICLVHVGTATKIKTLAQYVTHLILQSYHWWKKDLLLPTTLWRKFRQYS